MGSAVPAVIPPPLANLQFNCFSCGILRDERDLCECRACGERICSMNGCKSECRCNNVEYVANDFCIGTEHVMLIKDTEGRYVGLGDRVRELYDVRIGYSDRDLFGEQRANAIRMQEMRVLETNKPTECIMNVGDDTWLATKFPITMRDGTQYIGMHAVNITDKMNRALAVMES